MKIDVHVHAGEYPTHFTDDFASQMMAAVDQPREAMKMSPCKVLNQMDQGGIEKACLLAFDAERTLGVKVPNELVASICSAHSDRFIGFGSVDAGVPGAARSVETCIKDLGLKGIKLAPAYVHLSPDDPVWDEVYDVAQLLNVPVLLHTGFSPIKQTAQRFFPPMLIDRVARRYPRLRFILAHLGTPWVAQCLDLLVKHPNLYADLSIFGWFQPIKTLAGTLVIARAKGVLNRLLWGTDYPMCTLPSYVDRMHRLRQDESIFEDGPPLNEKEWAAIMGESALQVLTSEVYQPTSLGETGVITS